MEIQWGPLYSNYFSGAKGDDGDGDDGPGDGGCVRWGEKEGGGSRGGGVAWYSFFSGRTRILAKLLY